MKNLIQSLKEFKEELSASEDRRDVNNVMRIISQTIEDKKYYTQEE